MRRRDEGGLESHQLPGRGLQIRGAGRTGQVVRVGHSEHCSGFAGGEGLQADPIGQMGLQPAQPALVEPLAGQQQVHAQRASQPADRDKQFGELGMLTEQFGELVDHDEQRGQRRHGEALGPGMFIIGDIREVACGPEQFLPAVHLAGERVLHPRDEVRLVGQVGDDRRHMTYPVQAQKRRTALEVDQHQIEDVRRMSRNHPEDQRAQEFRLSRTGSTNT